MATLNRLKDDQIKKAKPKETGTITFNDGGGLILSVQPTGAKWWRFRYRFNCAPRWISMGVYPDTTLKAARAKRDDARRLLAQDPPLDPSEIRRAAKAAQADSFKVVSAEWFTDKQSGKAQRTRKRDRYTLHLLNERIGSQPIAKISTVAMQRALRAIQKKNGVDAAHRAHGIAARVYGYAIASGQASTDPTAGLKDSLKALETTHTAAITDPKKAGELLRSIETYTGHPATKAALQLLALNFTRPGEIRLGQWDEIDFDKKLWVIPASRMKARNKNPSDHLIPLADQSIAILKELQAVTGPDGYVFVISGDKPFSENTLNKALKQIKYGKGVHTAHGFRVMASTLLHELNFSPEVIETQLAHKRPGVAAIYNRSHLLPQRRKMLKAWADHLDQLRKGGNVVPINKKSA